MAGRPAYLAVLERVYRTETAAGSMSVRTGFARPHLPLMTEPKRWSAKLAQAVLGA